MPKAEKAEAEAKAKEVAKLAEFGDAELIERRQSLLSRGDDASVREALKLGKEVKRRNAESLDAEKAATKAIADKIIARVKELAKAGTDDANDLLIQAASLLG